MTKKIIEQSMEALNEPSSGQNRVVMRLLTPEEVDVVSGAGHSQGAGSVYTQGPGTNYTQGPGTVYTQSGGGGGHEN